MGGGPEALEPELEPQSCSLHRLCLSQSDVQELNLGPSPSLTHPHSFLPYNLKKNKLLCIGEIT